MRTAKTTTRLPSLASTFTHHGSVRNTKPTKRSDGTATLGRSAAALVIQARRGAVTRTRNRKNAVEVVVPVHVINGVDKLRLYFGDFDRSIIAILMAQTYNGLSNFDYIYPVSIAHIY